MAEQGSNVAAQEVALVLDFVLHLLAVLEAGMEEKEDILNKLSLLIQVNPIQLQLDREVLLVFLVLTPQHLIVQITIRHAMERLEQMA